MPIIQIFGPLKQIDKKLQNDLYEWAFDQCETGWIPNGFSKLPLNEDVLEFTSYFSKIATQVIEDKVESDTKVFICLCFSNASRSKCLKFPALDTNEQIEVIFFDCRIIYEVFSIIFFSPISRKKRILDGAIAIFKLSLASRLSIINDLELDKIILALTAEGGKMRINLNEKESSSTSFNKLLEVSEFSMFDTKMIIHSIGSYVLYHELAHILFKYSSELKDITKSNFKNLFDWINTDRDHVSEHFENGDIFHKVLKETEKMATAENIFSEQDAEEVNCDIFSISNTLHSVLLDGNTIPLIRSCLLLTNQFLNQMTGLGDYFKVYIKPFDDYSKGNLNELSQDERNDLYKNNFELAGSRLSRYKEIMNLRLFFNQKWIDSNIRSAHKQQNPEKDDNYISSLLLNGNYFHSTMQIFTTDLFESLNNDLLYEKSTQLSSLGRCLQGLYHINDQTLKASKYSDPFAFYLFDTVQYINENIE